MTTIFKQGILFTMSGHSKWAQIKRQKGAADIKKGAAFTKLANAVTVAVREGGGDATMNFKLRLAIEKARSANMPKENIERAIKRGTGELAGAALESAVYEGFGPGGAALIIEALTDNRNRTAQAVKTLLTKYGGTFGAPGSVGWMFQARGVIRLSEPENYSEDKELVLIELGAEDIIHDGNELVLLCASETIAALKDKLIHEGWVVISSEVALWPKSPVVFPTGSEGDKLSSLLESLEDNEDVQNVATTTVL